MAGNVREYDVFFHVVEDRIVQSVNGQGDLPVSLEKAAEALNQLQSAVRVRDIVMLVEALQFYASPDIYHAITFLFDPPTGELIDDFSTDHGDPIIERALPGKHAREVLTALGIVW